MAARAAARRPGHGRGRLLGLGVLLAVVWLAMGYRLFDVQVVHAAEYAEKGLQQRLVTRTLAAERGKIFDRDGNPLAMTVEAQSIYAVPTQIEDPLLTAKEVGSVLGKEPASLLQGLQGGGSFVYLARQVDPDVAQKVEALKLPGVYTHPEAKRVYPAGSVAAQVVGLVNIDGEGIEGLEYQYDSTLKGTPGELVFEQGRKGMPIPQGRTEIHPAIPGHDLVTSLDLPLEYQAQNSCEDTLARTGAKQCWIVVLQVETGDILALAGAPAYDPVARKATDGSPFSNFAIRGMYEPGSTQKLVTLSAALDTGTVGVNTVIPEVSDTYEVTKGACRSSTDNLYGCYQDFNHHPTRDMAVKDIFAESSNVGTIKISQRLPVGSLQQYMDAFGEGKPTGVDFSGEAPGAIRIDPGCSSCLASAAIGYTVAVSPLQMAAAYAAIGNDGVWIEPHFVASKVDVDGNVVDVQPQTHQVVSPATAATVRELLADVVLEGTGSQAKVPGYRVGGKTGTAEKYDNGAYTKETMASFVGMAPIDDPKIVVAVVVDSPDRRYETGGLAAAPAFAQVMEAALHRLGVTPDAVAG